VRHADEHPEWFEAGVDNFDASCPDALHAYNARVVDYLSEHPEIAIFSAWPADAPEWPRRAMAHFSTRPPLRAYDAAA
jgi:hypothetical protein